MLWLAEVKRIALGKILYVHSTEECLPLFLDRGLSGLCPFIRQTFNDASK